MLTILFVINSGVLFLTSLWTVLYADTHRSRSAVLSYSFLLAWANLIITANILSIFSKLQSAYLFFLVSTSLQIICIFTTIRLLPRRPNFRTNILFLFKTIKFGQYQILFFFLITLSISMVIICLCYTPFIPDTLAIKLPRALFYLQNQTLLPSPAVQDFELMWSPTVNATIPWLYFAIYRTDLNALLFFSLANWIIIGLSVFATCKALGASRKSSLLATGLLLMCEVIIMAGTADSDDIMAATPFAVALLGLVSWIKHPRYFHALVFGIGMGLSFGNKPFLIFYYPFFFLVLAAFIWRLGIKIVLYWIMNKKPAILIAGMAAISMAFGVFCENAVLRKNPLAFSKTYSPLRNTAANTTTMVINFASQNFTLFAAPAFAWYGDITSTRRATAEKVNIQVANWIESAFSVSQKELIEKHAAHGNNTEVMFDLYYDHGVQYGFFPHLVVICILFMSFRFSQKHLLPIILAASFIIWDITYCLHYKYIAGIIRYWMIIFVGAPPVIALAWDNLQISRGGRLERLLRICFVGILLISVAGSIKAIFKNKYRSIESILAGSNNRDLADSFGTPMQKIVRQLPAFNMILFYTNPIMQFMHLNPNAQYFLSREQKTDVPNILVSPERESLWVDFPVIPWRFVALPVEDADWDRNLYEYFGTCPGGGCYVNNLPPKFASGNKVLLLKINQPEIRASMSQVTVSPFVKSASLKRYELQFLEQTSEGKKIPLTKWLSVEDHTLVLRKSSKKLLVRMRRKGAKLYVQGEYAY